MGIQFIAELEPAISRERLAPYRAVSADDIGAVATYLYNLRLSEALYSPLSCLEISLRNSLNRNLQTFFGMPNWYDAPGVFKVNQRRDIQQAKLRAESSGVGVGNVQSSKVIAEFSFGFWTSLLSRDYDVALWQPNRSRLLRETFSFVPSHQRQRTTIYGRYNRFRALRNRVFHHEPIWNRATLRQDYVEILETIGWVSLAMKQALSVVDAFPDAFQAGTSRIANDLSLAIGLDS